MQIQPVTPDIADSLGLKNAEGALVAEPQTDSPAAKAGIEAGDVIIAVNGDAGAQCPRACPQDRRHGAGHDGQARSDPQGLGEDPQPDARRTADEREARAERRDRDRDYDYRRGRDRDERGDRRRDRDERRGDRDCDRSEAATRPVAGAGRQRAGVVVTEVDPDGPAADLGFKTGDVILDVAGKTVATPADVRKALDDARTEGKRTVLMRVKSEQGTRFVALPLGRA